MAEAEEEEVEEEVEEGGEAVGKEEQEALEAVTALPNRSTTIKKRCKAS